MPSIYILNPAPSYPGYHTSEAFATDAAGWVQVADLTIATVAALAPPGWDIRLTDEAISPVDLDADVDFVAITGKVSQRDRMIELSRTFRARGKTVLIGGSFASLSPEQMRPHADILVTGELEDLAPRLFADLASGEWADAYAGGQADIQRSPTPRWDLYPVHRALAGALQTTRGCPFNCEFCDVIQYQGRKQRHKNTDQILTELDELYRYGFRSVFVVDDNFTVHRQFAREVLKEIADWNRRNAGDRMRFMTQASIDIARDEDILDLAQEAGFAILFLGIETVNEASLRETGKRQNLLMPTMEAVTRIVRRGIAVQAGIIVGFDHDDTDIFDTLSDFFQASPLPDLAIGALNAPAATPLYRRLRAEGRLMGDVWDTSANSPFSTNIVPARMTRSELLDGVKALVEKAYSPECFEERLMNMIEMLESADRGEIRHSGPESDRVRIFSAVLQRVKARGPKEAAMVERVLRAAQRKPKAAPAVMYFLSRYEQARHLIDVGADRPAVEPMRAVA